MTMHLLRFASTFTHAQSSSTILSWKEMGGGPGTEASSALLHMIVSPAQNCSFLICKVGTAVLRINRYHTLHQVWVQILYKY